MAHPFNDVRDHKVQRARVKDITAACGGRAGGGHADAAEDRAMIHKMVKKSAMRADGGAVSARADRPARARGGRLGKKKSGGGKHTVNVIVGASHAPDGMPPRPPVPGVAAGAPPPAAPPPMPPKPMMPPPPGPMGGPPGVPGMPPGVPPPGMPRKAGGRTVSTSENAGIGKGRTPIRRDFPSNKDDTPNIGRGAVITKATGGPINASPTGQHGPKFSGGAMGGKARLEKSARAKRMYAAPENPKPRAG